MNKIFAIVITLSLTACAAGGLTPAQQAQYDRVKCEVKALTPVALDDADHVVNSIEDGNLSLADLLELIPVTEATAAAVKSAFSDCRHPTLLKSPPPAYGDKVL